MNATAKLVIRADDLGSFHGANRAIDQLLRSGLCRNAGIMVPAAYFTEGAELARNHTDSCIGLHATLNSEWASVRWRPVLPASRVPCLVEPDGTLKRSPHALHEAGADFDQMLAEIEAQLAKARAVGLNIEYLDQHMCFGWVHEPGHPEHRFEAVLCDFAKQKGLRYFATLPTDQGQITAINGQPLRPFHPAQGGDVTIPLSDAAAKGGAWLWVAHPAESEAELEATHLAGQAPGVVAKERDREWRILSDPQLASAVKRLGIQSIAVTDL